jgi:hypothetical protein
MKAPAMKFDAAAIGDFFLHHCEKFIVVIVGLGALALLWGGLDAVGAKSVRPEQTPQAIEAIAEKAVRHVDAQPKPPENTVVEGGRLEAAIDPWRPQQVKMAPAPDEQLVIDRPLFQELSKRSKPEVLPIEDLQAVAGIAVMPDTGDPNAARVADPAPAADDAAQKPRRRNRPERRPQEPSPAQNAVAGGPRARVVPYVVVTGLVPVTKQRDEFSRCFRSAGFRDAELDEPKWGQYLIERTSVTAGAGERWERLPVKNVPTFAEGANLIESSEPLLPEVLPQAFFMTQAEAELGYAAGMPQRLDDTWGPAAIHPWFIPHLKRMLTEKAPGFVAPRREVEFDAKKLAESPDAYEDASGTLKGVTFMGDPVPQRASGVVALEVASTDGVRFAADAVGAVATPVFVLAAPWARTLALDGGPTMGKKCNIRVRMETIGPTPVVHILGIRYLNADGQPGDELADPNPVPLAGGAGTGAGQGPEGSPDAGVEHRLFRFVDTSVKPGQQYRYRVKFALRNPNFGLDRQHLADPAAAKGEFLVSKESNITPVVSIPDPTSIVVRPISKDEIKQRKMKSGAFEILVMAPSSETGNYSLRSIVMEQGGLANVDSSLNKPGDSRTRGENIATERVLVDVRGRQDEGGKPTGPAEPFSLLFLKPDGTFELVSAADSQEAFDRYATTLPLGEGGVKDDRPQPGAPPGFNPFDVPPR